MVLIINTTDRLLNSSRGTVYSITLFLVEYHTCKGTVYSITLFLVEYSTCKGREGGYCTVIGYQVMFNEKSEFYCTDGTTTQRQESESSAHFVTLQS